MKLLQICKNYILKLPVNAPFLGSIFFDLFDSSNIECSNIEKKSYIKRRRSFDKWVRKFFKIIRIEILKKRIKKLRYFGAFLDNFWGPRWVSNPRPSEPQTDALTN